MRLIGKYDLVGEMAGWAVRQSPYLMPDGLREALTVLVEAAEADFHDGATGHEMRWFQSPRELDAWLQARLIDHSQYLAWNRPKSGHDAPFIFVSRYGGPSPDNDIIDLHALFWNVARACWDHAAEYEKEPIDPVEPPVIAEGREQP